MIKALVFGDDDKAVYERTLDQIRKDPQVRALGVFFASLGERIWTCLKATPLARVQVESRAATAYGEFDGEFG